jgi:hypothetical protein
MEAEICAKCIQKKIPIREVAISYNPRSIQEGKKINSRDAWKAFKTMWTLKF